MASLIDMYSSSAAPDISGDLRNLRQEERDRDAKNWKGSKDLLRGVASDTIRKDYKNGISWDNGVKSADDSFKKQYDRMMSVDPQAAAQLKADYQLERSRRLNSEVAAAYGAGTKAVEGDIAGLEAEIARLESEVADEEAAEEADARESARLEDEASKAVPLLPGQVPSAGPLSDQTPMTAPWSSPIDEFIPREQPPMRFGLSAIYGGR